jgi:hypothetical protein
MKEQWRDTLQCLLQTRKPVICTAHSEKDLDRDLAFIDSLVADDTQDLGEPLEVIQVRVVCVVDSMCYQAHFNLFSSNSNPK